MVEKVHMIHWRWSKGEREATAGALRQLGIAGGIGFEREERELRICS